MSIDDRLDEVRDLINAIKEAGKLLAGLDFEQDFCKEIHAEIISALKSGIAKAKPHKELLDKCLTALEAEEDKLRLDADKKVELAIKELTQKLKD